MSDGGKPPRINGKTNTGEEHAGHGDGADHRRPGNPGLRDQPGDGIAETHTMAVVTKRVAIVLRPCPPAGAVRDGHGHGEVPRPTPEGRADEEFR